MPGVYAVPKGYAWLVERAIRQAVEQARRLAKEDGPQFSTADEREALVEVIVRDVPMADAPGVVAWHQRQQSAA